MKDIRWNGQSALSFSVAFADDKVPFAAYLYAPEARCTAPAVNSVQIGSLKEGMRALQRGRRLICRFIGKPEILMRLLQGSVGKLATVCQTDEGEDGPRPSL